MEWKSARSLFLMVALGREKEKKKKKAKKK
jgi:hypothetical protein